MDAVVASAVAELGTKLTVLATTNIAATVMSRFSVMRQQKKIEEICNAYEEIVNELVADRAQAISIASAYQAELNRFEITDADIEHLQRTVSRVLGLLQSLSSDSAQESMAVFGSVESLLSRDTLKAMQLLGFDYKKAIGDPLTEVCADTIRAKLKPSTVKDKKAAKK